MTSSDGFPPEDEQAATPNDGEWISNEPPVDDFGDPSVEASTVAEEGDEVAQEHAQDYEQEEIAPVEAEGKKKFPLMLLAGAVGSLIVVGALGYWQFGRHHGAAELSVLDAPGAGVSMPSFASRPAAPPVAAAPPPAQEVAPTTAYSQPSSVAESSNSAKTAASASPVAGSVEPAAPVPVAPSDAVSSIQPAAETPSAPPPVMGTVVIPPPQATATDARLTALSSRMDDLQKILTQATDQLGQISDKLAAVQASASAPAPVSAPTDAAMQERLNKLEQKIMQMEQQRQPVHSASAENVTPSKAPIKSKHARAHTTKRKAVSRAVAVKAPSQKWVLRAATPEEAWIAKNSEARELRPVHVGDNVPGIGKVTAIRQTGDVWSLQGTTGILR